MTRHILRGRKRHVVTVAFLAGVGFAVHAHDIGTTPITWNREISRIVYDRCASCHHNGGTAFSLMTYSEAQPRAVAIKNAVLTRQMPPWGAVKGFGAFRNDQGLTQEQIEVITDWVQSDMPKGNNPNALPKVPKFAKLSAFRPPKDAIALSGDLRLDHPLTLDGIWPDDVPEGSSTQIVAALPDGSIEPLLWLYQYKPMYQHPFLFRRPLDLPAGTIIRGAPAKEKFALIPAKQTKSSK